MQLKASGKAIFSKNKPNSRFSKASSNGRFIKAGAAKWLDIQIRATDCKFHNFPHNQLISGRAKQFLAKAGPMAVLSKPAPRAVFWPSNFQQKPAQWPFYQGQLQLRLYQADAIKSFWQSHFQQKHAQWPRPAPMAVLLKQKQPMARHLDLSHGLQIPEFPAQSVYQRPGQAIFEHKPCFIKASYNSRFINANAFKIF